MEHETKRELAIAAGTAVLTAALSGLVISCQLSSEHRFAEQRELSAKRQQLLAEKIRLQRSVSELIGSTVAATSMLNSVMLLQAVARTREAPDEDLQLLLVQRAFDATSDLGKARNQLLAELDTAKHFFGKGVNDAIKDYFGKNDPPLPEMVGLTTEAGLVTDDVTFTELLRNFTDRVDLLMHPQILAGSQLVESMAAEIEADARGGDPGP